VTSHKLGDITFGETRGYFHITALPSLSSTVEEREICGKLAQ